MALAVRVAVDAMRWDERHARLAAHPAFARCARPEIRRLARAGDEVTVDAGSVLLNEDAIGYWFVAVLEGSVSLRRGGRDVGVVGAGGHVGDVAILGFGPQPATAVVSSPVARLFVVGRRNLLDLVHAVPGFRAGLLPEAGASFDLYVRALRAAGAEAWRRLPKSRHPAAAAAAASARSAELRFVRRGGGRGGSAGLSGVFTTLARSVKIFGSPTPESLHGTEQQQPPTGPVRERLSTRARLVVAGVVVAIGIAVGATYHPPLLVVQASEPIDVGARLSIEGVPSNRAGPPINGRYLLTAVDVRQPAAFGIVGAFLSGAEIVGAAPHDDGGMSSATARRLGEEQFDDSRRRALAAVAARAGLDPRTVHVEFDEHHLSGPSAGLVYALALADLLDPADLAAGRTIAATGSLEPADRIGAVGFVRVKGDAARRGGADVFLVPSPQASLVDDRDVHAVSVDTLDAAIAYLTDGRGGGVKE